VHPCYLPVMSEITSGITFEQEAYIEATVTSRCHFKELVSSFI